MSETQENSQSPDHDGYEGKRMAFKRLLGSHAMFHKSLLEQQRKSLEHWQKVHDKVMASITDLIGNPDMEPPVGRMSDLDMRKYKVLRHKEQNARAMIASIGENVDKLELEYPENDKDDQEAQNGKPANNGLDWGTVF